MHLTIRTKTYCQFGATAVEYALTLAVVVSLVMGGARLMESPLTAAFRCSAEKIMVAVNGGEASCGGSEFDIVTEISDSEGEYIAPPDPKNEKDFSDFLPEVLEDEGGFVDHPADRGGATNKGITFETFQMYAEEHLGIEPTLENFKSLTDEQAGIIYKKEYWDRVGGDSINDPELAYQLTDIAINSGVGGSMKMIQRTLNEKFGYDLEVDGGQGPKTLQAINAVDSAALYRGLRESRIQFYNDIVVNDPSQSVFLDGWLNRANSFDAY